MVLGWTFITNQQKCLPITSNHPNHCKRKIPFCLARRICTIAENNSEKVRKLENLKSNLFRYHYPDLPIRQGIQKALSIPLQDFRGLKESSAANILPFTTTYNPNNPNIFKIIKSSAECIKKKTMLAGSVIQLIQSKQQALNLKKI